MKMGTYNLGNDPFVSLNNGVLDYIYPMIPPIFDSRLVEEIYNQCN